MTRRAIVYARISRDRTGAGLGVDRQVQDCRALAQRLDWRVVAEEIDNDISAYSGKPRPGYGRLLEHLKAGRADAVLTWHTDRLHRSPRELETFIDIVEAAGADVQTVTAGPVDLATPSGRMVARQLGAVARYETERTVERIRRAKVQAAASGKWLGGRRPFAYSADGMRLVPVEAGALRNAYAAILAGRSLGSLVREWNAAGLTTTAGKQWTVRALARVLLRERNAGLMRHQGKIVGEAAWPAVIDAATWRGAAKILRHEERRTAPLGGQRRWMLSGLAHCGICGQPVKSATSATGRHGKRPAYACPDKHVVRDALTVDQFVADLVIARLSQPDAAEAFRQDGSDDAAWLTARRADLAREVDEAAALYAEGVLRAEQLRTITGRLRAQLAEIDERLAVNSQHAAVAAVVTGADVAATWQRLTVDQRRAAIQALGLIVTINPARKGRPPGWRPGEPYHDLDAIGVEWGAS